MWDTVRIYLPPPRPHRERELQELQLLYNRVVPERFLVLAEGYISAVCELLDSELSEPMRRALLQIVYAEQAFAPPDFSQLDLQQQVELKKKLKKWELRREDGEKIARDFLYVLFGFLAKQLPKTNDPSPFTIPLIYAVPEAKRFISTLTAELFDDQYRDRDLFENLREQLYFNLCDASGIDPEASSKKKLIHARDSTLPLDEVARVYLRKTPLYGLFTAPVPLRLTHEERFNHWHLLAGSGQGKTTLIENLIRHDLRSPDPPSIVLIDPHSDLVRKLVKSDLGLDDRLILIDPRDTKHPVALNPLAVNQERLATYDEATREQVTAGVIQTFGYLWNGLTSLTLTGKQDVFFRYVTRLLLTIPEVKRRNPTILDMLTLMSKPEEYADVIEALPPIPQDFFKRDFNAKSFEGTKEQIRYRIQAIIESPTMARLFTAPETKIDFFTELNRGSVILIDTAKDFLKEGSSIFGKLMISQILQAVLERAAIPERDRKATFLIIDEAGSYFSQNIDDLLTEARKYKCGLMLSHQYLDQASHSLRASLAANTGIKFASGLSAADARAMAPEMRTSADFILSQPKLQFAAHIRNVTPQAVSVPTAHSQGLPQLSHEAYSDLVERNRAKVSLPALPAPLRQTGNVVVIPTPEPEGDEDISREW